jgi:hypothetical protein
VAIKAILPSLAEDEDRRKRFKREAQLAARISHTHAVHVHSILEQEGRLYLVMEYVDGESLDQIVARDGPLGWREATAIIRDAAQGLAAAHALGMVHRDVKPANLMRSKKGVTKVVDFGLARDTVADSRMTFEGAVVGTPAFMAPEQWAGRELDARADIYSLICTYYFLLTGRTPFEAAAPGALGYLHTNEPFPDPRQTVSALPDGVCRILLRGARKEAAERFASCAELCAQLDALLASPGESLIFETPWTAFAEEEDARPGPAPAAVASGSAPPWLAGSQDFARRQPAVLIGGAAAVLAVIGLVCWFSFGAPGPQVVADKPREPESKTPGPPLPPAPTRAGTAGAAKGPVAAPVEADMAPMPALLPMETPLPPPEPTLRPIAELPPIVEVAPVFAPRDEVATVRAAALAARRKEKLEGLTERTVASIVPAWYAAGMPAAGAGPGPFPGVPFPGAPGIGPGIAPPAKPAAAATPFPARFVLVGELQAIRAAETSTWLYLMDPALEVVRPNGAPPPFLAVELPGENLVEALADYRAGESVRVVVNVKAWNSVPAPVEAVHFSALRLFRGGSQPQIAYWCFAGEAVEKSARPIETWVDAALGRADTLANREAWRHGLGAMLRSPAFGVGASGRLLAQFQRVARVDGKLRISVTIPGTCEGSLPAVIDLGPTASVAEFLDYAAGSAIECDVVAEPFTTKEIFFAKLAGGKAALGELASLAGGLSALQQSAQLDPLTSRLGLTFSAQQVQLEGQPPTRIAAIGARRLGVAAALPATITTPDAVVAAPADVIGREATWSGKLNKVRRRQGVTHVLMDVENSILNLKQVEAYSDDPQFLSELRDYQDAELDRKATADPVTFHGTIMAADAIDYRLNAKLPLVKLAWIERTGDAATRVATGIPRQAASFRSVDSPSLVALLREAPAAGERLSFRAVFQSFTSATCVVHARTAESSGPEVKVSFPRASSSDFSDYKLGDLIDVVAVAPEGWAYESSFRTPALVGETVVRVKNARSLVNAKERPIPPPDFALAEQQWREMLRAPKLRKTLHAGGTFDGYSDGGSYVKITIRNAFYKFRTLELFCKADKSDREYLDSLQPGDEVLFDFSVAGSTERDSKTVLISMGPLSDPQKKTRFTPLRIP